MVGSGDPPTTASRCSRSRCPGCRTPASRARPTSPGCAAEHRSRWERPRRRISRPPGRCRPSRRRCRATSRCSTGNGGWPSPRPPSPGAPPSRGVLPFLPATADQSQQIDRSAQRRRTISPCRQRKHLPEHSRRCPPVPSPSPDRRSHPPPQRSAPPADPTARTQPPTTPVRRIVAPPPLRRSRTGRATRPACDGVGSRVHPCCPGQSERSPVRMRRLRWPSPGNPSASRSLVGLPVGHHSQQSAPLRCRRVCQQQRRSHRPP